MKETKYNWFKLLIGALVPLAIIMTIFILGVRKLGGGEYQKLVDFISNNYFGLPEIFLFVYLVDTFIVPLTPDLIFPLVVGMDWYIIIPLIGIASSLGGITGYCLGSLCSKIPFIRRLTNKMKDEWRERLDKYGVYLIILAALTPIPFSTVAWASGVLGYQKRKAFPAFFFRVIRMGLYFILFKAGLSTALL